MKIRNKFLNKIKYPLLLLLMILATVSCKENNTKTSKSNKSIDNTERKKTVANTKKIDTLLSKDFSIVKLDFYDGALFRVFVVIEADLINEQNKIAEILCQIENHYNTANGLNISFFTDKKYANYKDVLFFNDNPPLNKKEYDDWMNKYYLAEFDSETRILKTYPAAENFNKRRKDTVKICL